MLHFKIEAVGNAREHFRQVTGDTPAAYLATWQILPVPEVCGLVSDDAETLATLLLAGAGLTPFSRDRLGWYLAGRIPFGYVGEYPEGQWIVL